MELHWTSGPQSWTLKVESAPSAGDALVRVKSSPQTTITQLFESGASVVDIAITGKSEDIATLIVSGRLLTILNDLRQKLSWEQTT